jgi:hypothetical protein
VAGKATEKASTPDKLGSTPLEQVMEEFKGNKKPIPG